MTFIICEDTGLREIVQITEGGKDEMSVCSLYVHLFYCSGGGEKSIFGFIIASGSNRPYSWRDAKRMRRSRHRSGWVIMIENCCVVMFIY